MKVGCLILNYNDYQTTIEHISRIKEYNVFSNILVVDNKSTNNSLEELEKYKSNKIEVISNERNGGYGYGNNEGIKYLWNKYKLEFILVSNPDTVYSEKTIQELLNRFDDDIAVVAPLTLTSQHTPQVPVAIKYPKKYNYYVGCSLILNRLFKPFEYQYKDISDRKELIVEGVQGSLFLIKTKHFIDSGMYNENIFLYFEESTLAKRLQNIGYKEKLCLDLSYIHNHGVSIKKSVSSDYRRRIMMLESLLQFEKDEYNLNHLEMIIRNIYLCLCKIENYIMIKCFSFLVRK